MPKKKTVDGTGLVTVDDVPDEQRSTSELIDMVVGLREQVRQLQTGSQFAFRTLQEIAVLLDPSFQGEDSVNIDWVKRRIIELQMLQRCGVTEEFPTLFPKEGDIGSTTVVGPCMKVRDHMERGDAWHRADDGVEWKLGTTVTAKNAEGRGGTFNVS